MEMIAASDCKSCHMVDQKSAGPAFREVAKRYVKELKAVEILSEKVLRGGSGVWGTTAMAAHPQLSREQAQLMVEYILSLAKEQLKASLPLDGSVKTGRESEGAYVLQASYTDRGAEGVPSLSDSKIVLLKKPFLEASAADQLSVASKFSSPTGDVVLNNVKHNATALFKSIDLTNVSTLEPVAYLIKGQTDGEVEVYVDGKKLGTTSYARIPGTEVMKGVKMKSSKLALGKVSGLHDISLVFKNDKAGDKNLFFFGKVRLGN
jgi:cytochrome c